jgi:hypothetical protein
MITPVMERAVQILAAVNFLVIGTSHIFQPRAWVVALGLFLVWLVVSG